MSSNTGKASSFWVSSNRTQTQIRTDSIRVQPLSPLPDNYCVSKASSIKHSCGSDKKNGSTLSLVLNPLHIFYFSSSFPPPSRPHAIPPLLFAACVLFILHCRLRRSFSLRRHRVARAPVPCPPLFQVSRALRALRPWPCAPSAAWPSLCWRSSPSRWD